MSNNHSPENVVNLAEWTAKRNTPPAIRHLADSAMGEVIHGDDTAMYALAAESKALKARQGIHLVTGSATMPMPVTQHRTLDFAETGKAINNSAAPQPDETDGMGMLLQHARRNPKPLDGYLAHETAEYPPEPEKSLQIHIVKP